ncbi:MAG: hypothetical protein MZU97_12080 [Bacillus subtilis]|nr:hypothetical protein [Bacillus subtilis]
MLAAALSPHRLHELAAADHRLVVHRPWPPWSVYFFGVNLLVRRPGLPRSTSRTPAVRHHVHLHLRRRATAP